MPTRELEPVRLELVAAPVALTQPLPLGDEHADSFLYAFMWAGWLDAKLVELPPQQAGTL